MVKQVINKRGNICKVFSSPGGTMYKCCCCYQYLGYYKCQKINKPCDLGACLVPAGGCQVSFLRTNDPLAQGIGTIAQARPQSGVLGDGRETPSRMRNSRGQGSPRLGLGGANLECACALHALGEEAAVSRAPRRCFSRLWPASPENPVSSGYTQGGDVSRAREGATMPVRRAAQPLGFLIPAAWLGGAAVAIEARSRREARVGRGRAGPSGPRPLRELAGGPSVRGGPAHLGKHPGACPVAFVPAASRGACAV